MDARRGGRTFVWWACTGRKDGPPVWKTRMAVRTDRIPGPREAEEIALDVMAGGMRRAKAIARLGGHDGPPG